MSDYHVKKPCKNCPFRKDTLKGWLGKERAKEIVHSDTFVCHKTTNKKQEDFKQCAGHILLNKEDNSMYRVSKQFGIDLEMKGEETVFESKEDFIKHHDYTRD